MCDRIVDKPTTTAVTAVDNGQFYNCKTGKVTVCVILTCKTHFVFQRDHSKVSEFSIRTKESKEYKEAHKFPLVIVNCKVKKNLKTQFNLYFISSKMCISYLI